MKLAIDMGGAESRIALMKLENLLFAHRAEDAALNQLILDSTPEETIVDIIAKFQSHLEPVKRLDEGAVEALDTAATAVLDRDAEVVRDAGDPRMDPDASSKEEAEAPTTVTTPT